MAQRDYDINDCYNHFISKAEDDKVAYKNELSESEKNVDYLYSLLIGWQYVIKNKFDINLCNCIEFRNKTYNENEELYNKTVRLAKIFEDEESIKLLNTLIKYCHAIKNVHLCLLRCFFFHLNDDYFFYMNNFMYLCSVKYR